MTRAVLRHEMRILAADRFLLLLGVLTVLMLGAAVVQGSRHARIQANQLHWAEEGDRTRLSILLEEIEAVETGRLKPESPLLDPRDPSLAARERARLHATLPPAPLAATAIGQSDLFPVQVVVTLQEADALGAREEIQNPLNLLAGSFDVAFVVVFLLPLVVLALGYDLLSREREAGMLGLLLSQPVTLGQLLAGKLAARALVILALTIPPVAVGAALLAPDRPTPTTFVLLLLWGTVVSGYVLFWLLVAAVANLLGRSSAGNAVAFKFTWVMFLLVVPGLLYAGAQILHPAPSRTLLVGETREATRAAEEVRSQLLARFYQEHPELAPDGEEAFRELQALSLAIQEEVERRVRPLKDEIERSIASQRALVRRLRFASPAILVQEALYDIAGTGDHRFLMFQKEVDRFHEEWVRFFAPLIYCHEELTPADLDRLPNWRGVDDPPSAVAGRVARSLAGLLALGTLLAALGFLALRRFTVAGP